MRERHPDEEEAAERVELRAAGHGDGVEDLRR
jgi:hypothetical protein